MLHWIYWIDLVKLQLDNILRIYMNRSEIPIYIFVDDYVIIVKMQRIPNAHETTDIQWRIFYESENHNYIIKI